MSFFVLGHPQTQGSKRHVGKGIMVEKASLRPWREAVAWEARNAWQGQNPLRGPVSLSLAFQFHRPRSHYRTGKNAHRLRESAPSHPCTRSSGDTDKLCRAIGDALDGICYLDDSQIASLVATKTYAEDEGVHVTVESL